MGTGVESGLFGTLRLWLPADCGTVDEVLTYVEQGLQGLQGRRIVPKEASFQPNTSARAGGTLSGSLGIRSFASLPRPERWGSTISVQPVVTLGRVGISMAGDENPESDREYWPRLLCELLRQHSQNRFQVICYRDSDHQTRSTDQLIGDLAACDLLIAVISEKYLKSKYCMVELLLAARKWSIAQNEHHSKAPGFLGDHKEWLSSIWFVILKEVEELCVEDAAISDGAHAWSNEWYEKGFEYTSNLKKKFRNDALAQEHGARANAYDAWMRFVATGDEAAKKFLAAIRHSNDRLILSLQDRRVDEDRDTWASGLLAPYITNKLLPAILTKLDGMDPSQRIQRCVEIAIRYQQRGDVAGFDQYVNQALRESPNSPVVATQLQEGNLPSGFEALRPYLADWKQRQGSGAN